MWTFWDLWLCLCEDLKSSCVSPTQHTFILLWCFWSFLLPSGSIDSQLPTIPLIRNTHGGWTLSSVVLEIYWSKTTDYWCIRCPTQPQTVQCWSDMVFMQIFHINKISPELEALWTSLTNEDRFNMWLNQNMEHITEPTKPQRSVVWTDETAFLFLSGLMWEKIKFLSNDVLISSIALVSQIRSQQTRSLFGSCFTVLLKSPSYLSGVCWMSHTSPLTSDWCPKSRLDWAKYS